MTSARRGWLVCHQQAPYLFSAARCQVWTTHQDSVDAAVEKHAACNNPVGSVDQNDVVKRHQHLRFVSRGAGRIHHRAMYTLVHKVEQLCRCQACRRHQAWRAHWAVVSLELLDVKERDVSQDRGFVWDARVEKCLRVSFHEAVSALMNEKCEQKKHP